MRDSDNHYRVLIYSHDTFGLGHLRRCREIAHSMVAYRKDVSVLILSGSPIIGSFDFHSRVDFVRVPGVIKKRDGEYGSLNLHLALDQTLAMRASIIRHTAEVFAPHLFIVDKEPLGLRGEVRETLEMLRARGTSLVLGLRDVLDEPALLAPEWERKNALPALRDLYDDIWVYGLPQMCDPLADIDMPPSVRRKVSYTGYLRRAAPEMPPRMPQVEFDDPYLLVTGGGGGDGEGLVDWVLAAYERERFLPWPALVVFGPFMQPSVQAGFVKRIESLDRVRAITFDANFEWIMKRAAAVVAMGGYNTFCEILSFNKRALLVPRTRPRLEQFIRASRAEELGLVRMLVDEGEGWREPVRMAEALRRLPEQRVPSEVVVPGLLDGLVNVNRLVDLHLAQHAAGAPEAAEVVVAAAFRQS